MSLAEFSVFHTTATYLSPDPFLCSRSLKVLWEGQESRYVPGICVLHRNYVWTVTALAPYLGSHPTLLTLPCWTPSGFLSSLDSLNLTCDWLALIFSSLSELVHRQHRLRPRSKDMARNSWKLSGMKWTEAAQETKNYKKRIADTVQSCKWPYKINNCCIQQGTLGTN